MGRKRKQAKHLEKARARKAIIVQINHYAKTCKYVLSCALFGISQTQGNKFMFFNGHWAPNKTDFYLTQKLLIQKVHGFVKSKIEIIKKSIEGSFYMRLDCSWSIRRNATHCLVEIIDDRNLIIDYDYISCADPKTIWLAQKSGFFQDTNTLHWVTAEGKFLGPSTLMEDFLVARLSEKWKIDSNLLGYIHDGNIGSLIII